MIKRSFILMVLVGVFLSGCVTAYMPVYRQEYAVTQSLPEIEASLTPVGQGWKLVIMNNSSEMVKLLVEESRYVSTDGKASRLIAGNTRAIVSSWSQPPFTIPPKARYEEFILPEDLTSADDFSLFLMPAFPMIPDMPGKFYFTFEINNSKKVLISEVKFVRTTNRQRQPIVPVKSFNF